MVKVSYTPKLRTLLDSRKQLKRHDTLVPFSPPAFPLSLYFPSLYINKKGGMLVSGPPKPVTSRHNRHTCCQATATIFPESIPPPTFNWLCHHPYIKVPLISLLPPSLSLHHHLALLSLSINLTWNCLAWCGPTEAVQRSQQAEDTFWRKVAKKP